MSRTLGLLGSDDPGEGSQILRIRLLGLSGPGATPLHPTAAHLLRSDLRTRVRLAALGVLLGRVAARPRVHCDSPWAVRMSGGLRGVLQAPAERWPFAGVGMAIGVCRTHGAAAAAAAATAQACCSAVYGRALMKRQVDCVPSVHASFLSDTARRLRARNGSGPLEVPLAELPRRAGVAGLGVGVAGLGAGVADSRAELGGWFARGVGWVVRVWGEWALGGQIWFALPRPPPHSARPPRQPSVPRTPQPS